LTEKALFSRKATAEGEWIRPPALPGTFVVNTGAMLARYSNDRFRATPHRVIDRYPLWRSPH
jgi:isopenicillin N synthase-like dioxygenase